MKNFPSHEEMEQVLQERQRTFFLKWQFCGIDDGSVMNVFDRNLMDKQSTRPGLKSGLEGQLSMFLAGE